MPRMLRCSALLFLLVFVGLLVGCGGSGGTKVTGRLLNNGQPFVPGQGEQVTVSFNGVDVPISSQGPFDPATSTFTIVGGEGHGVPPGNYKITVVSRDASYKDKLNSAFDGDKTPLSYQVTNDSNQKIDVDIGKKTVTKQ